PGATRPRLWAYGAREPGAGEYEFVDLPFEHRFEVALADPVRGSRTPVRAPSEQTLTTAAACSELPDEVSVGCCWGAATRARIRRRSGSSRRCRPASCTRSA